jgi:hypothetical protein
MNGIISLNLIRNIIAYAKMDSQFDVDSTEQIKKIVESSNYVLLDDRSEQEKLDDEEYTKMKKEQDVDEYGKEQ